MTPDQIERAGRLLTQSGWQTGLADRLGRSRNYVTSAVTQRGGRSISDADRQRIIDLLRADADEASALASELEK